MIYDTICHECATSLGWTPVTMTDSEGNVVGRPVGMWEGACDMCGLTKAVCASRDYDKPGMRRLTMTEALEALFIAQLRDSQPPPGEEEIEEPSMERLMRYEITVKVSVPVAFDEGDSTPDDPAKLKEILGENALEIIMLDPEQFIADIQDVRLIEDSSKPDVNAEMVTVWDDLGEIATQCRYDPENKRAYDIEMSDADPQGNQTDEFVRLADGTEIRHEDGLKIEGFED